MIKTGFSRVPQSIIKFEKKTSVEGLSDKWKQGQISKEDLKKPYVTNAYWESGFGGESNASLCTKEEVIDVVIKSKNGSFDVEIYNFKTCEYIDYSVDYIVTLEE